MSNYNNCTKSFFPVATCQQALPSLVSTFHRLSLLFCLSRLLSLILVVKLPFSLIWKICCQQKELITFLQAHQDGKVSANPLFSGGNLRG